MENDKICTPWKTKGKSQLENDRMGNKQPENDRKVTPQNWQKKYPCKITEWKMHNIENDRKCIPRKLRENHTWKMTEQKMYIWKMIENHIMKNDIKSMPGKCMTWKMYNMEY